MPLVTVLSNTTDPGAFYQMHKSAQKTHWVIIRALAYKWIRILCRC